MRTPHKTMLALAAAGLSMASITAQATPGYVTVSASGTPILTTCNPKPSSPTVNTCSVTSLPGVSGYTNTASRSAPIIINNVTIGTLYDRVYRSGTTSTYILAMRANLNTSVWHPNDNLSFEINDFFRGIKSTVGADVAYFEGTVSGGTNPDTALATKYLEYSGNTFKGLSQFTGAAGDRDNGHIDFRADTNANDPDGGSSPWSPWMMVRQVCSGGVNTTTPTSFGIKLWEGGEEGQFQQPISTSGYTCT